MRIHIDHLVAVLHSALPLVPWVTSWQQKKAPTDVLPHRCRDGPLAPSTHRSTLRSVNIVPALCSVVHVPGAGPSAVSCLVEISTLGPFLSACPTSVKRPWRRGLPRASLFPVAAIQLACPPRISASYARPYALSNPRGKWPLACGKKAGHVADLTLGHNRGTLR